jgi:heme-degrading monooxygenase HmoA
MFYAVVERQVHPNKLDAYLTALRHQVESWARHHARTLQRVMVVQSAEAGKNGDIPVVILTHWRTAADFTDAYAAEPPDQWMDVVRQVAEPVEPYHGYRPIFEQCSYRHAPKLATVKYLIAPPNTTAKIDAWARTLAGHLPRYDGVLGFRLLEVVDRPEEYIAATEYGDVATREIVERDLEQLPPPVPVQERRVSGEIRYLWMPLDQLVQAGR